VTTRNILTRLLRLQQVTGGFIRDDEGHTVEQVSDSKLLALEDVIDDILDAGKKVVVFARFIPEIDAICRKLERKGLQGAVITGAVKNRAEQVRRFQEEADCRVFIAQIQTAGLGITLTAADTAVFYSLDFNYANYSQARARIHRIGQRNNCLYIHLVAKNTIDEQILRALQRKEDIAKTLVDNWKTLFAKEDVEVG